MSFIEASTVENMVRDLLCGGVTHHTAVAAGLASKGSKLAGPGWHYLAPANAPRQLHKVLVEDPRSFPTHQRQSPRIRLQRLAPETSSQE